MKLSLKRKPLSPSSRFNETVTEDMIEQSSKGIISSRLLRHAAKASSWAIRTFSDWITQRNKHNSEVFPSDLFDKPYPRLVACKDLYPKQEEWMERRTHQKPCTRFCAVY